MAVTERVSWIDADNVETVLHIGLNAQMGDMIGRFMPPVTHVDDVLPFQPGGRLRFSVQTEKDFTMPCNILRKDNANLRNDIRNLVTAMNPMRGPGIVRVTSPLGDVREIPCIYVSGLDLAENPMKNGRFGQQAYITFRAFDPYWRDTADTGDSWDAGLVPSFFPFFPLRLSSGAVVVNDVVINDGDVLTWPVWTIIGPGGGSGGIGLTNVTTKQSILFQNTTLGSGESITIDTRPGIKTVLKQDGTNLFPDLDPASVLWPLQRGSNAINLILNNATAGTTALTLGWRRKWLSP